MTERPNLSSVLSLARSGATSRAWEAFVAAGLADVTDDPAALTLKGRLLKDQARKAKGGAAARLYLQSAKAYADAAALRPDSYPLINAATMSLFAGQPGHMELLAQKVLTMLDTGIGAGETAYWHEATRAEALLLLGRQRDAQAALSKAIIAAPAAWEDRAATLRQFRQISEFRGEACQWLADYAPPASVYFKGMIGIAPDDERAATKARDAVSGANAGFGYGAVAAGADILIAEALIEHGGELHLVLPILPSGFRMQSVAPYGEAWLPRFDRLFEQAASVTIVTAGDELAEAAINFAAQVAKGAAIENAGRLEGHAKGLELNDSPSPEFESVTDVFVALERSALLPPMTLAKGNLLVALVCDQIGNDPEGWAPVADGFYARSPDSLTAANALLAGLGQVAPEARCAIGVAADAATDADAQLAKILRMAQAATAGTSLADVCSARAMLAGFPKMRTEPLGELPDTGGAIEICAIEPEA
jgi:tetratricopeptide (TPR) repeat protein